MNKFFSLILLVICCYNSLVSTISVQDWYWRDYNGLIPNDALATGINIKGQLTYVAQIIVPSRYTPEISPFAILPAIVSNGGSHPVASYYKDIVKSDLNVKILCTVGYPEQYKWLEPTSVIPVGCKYVVGGTEVIRDNKVSEPTYIGQVILNGEIITGRLLNYKDGLVPLMYYPYNGTEQTTYLYRALFYCPN